MGEQIPTVTAAQEREIKAHRPYKPIGELDRDALREACEEYVERFRRGSGAVLDGLEGIDVRIKPTKRSSRYIARHRRMPTNPDAAEPESFYTEIKVSMDTMQRSCYKWEDLCHTLRHELIHGHLAHKDLPSGHTERFIWLCDRVAVNGERYKDSPETPKYGMECTSCGSRSSRERMCSTVKAAMPESPDNLKCGVCNAVDRWKVSDISVADTLPPEEPEPLESAESGTETGAAGVDTINVSAEASAETETVPAQCDSCGETQAETKNYGGTLIYWCDTCGAQAGPR